MSYDGECQRSDCSAKPAKFVPIIRFWAKGYPKTPKGALEFGFGIWVCGDCKDSLKIDDVIDDRGWQRIVDEMKRRGKADPDRTSLELDWFTPKETSNDAGRLKP